MAYQVNQSVIDKAKKDYADAQARGDKAGMEAAHAAAEAERAKAGYSGGADGSQYISLGGSNNSSSNNSSTSSGGSSSGGSYNYYDDYKAQMQANSKEWHTASEQRRKELEAENQRLGALMGGSYDANTGKWSDSSGNDLYDYSAIVGGTQTPKAQGTPITYYDKQGNPYTGYTIDNRTYKDPYGNERIDVGMLVPTSDLKTWYEMGADGGFATVAPDWAYTLDPQYKQIMELQKLMMQQRDPSLDARMAELDAIVEKLREFTPTDAMSYEEAFARATAQAGGQYDENIAQLINAYNQNAISRGMFGQSPTEAIKMEALAANELQRATNLNALAGDLRMDDFNEKQLLDQNYLNRLQQEAGLTQDLYNLEMQQWQQQQEARLNAINMYMQQQADTYSKAMDKLNTLGYADAEVAKALGIPEGTLSTDDRVAQAEFERQKELMAYEQQLNKEMADYQASLSAKYSKGSGGGTPKPADPERVQDYYDTAVAILKAQGVEFTNEDVFDLASALMNGGYSDGGFIKSEDGATISGSPDLGAGTIRDYGAALSGNIYLPGVTSAPSTLRGTVDGSKAIIKTPGEKRNDEYIDNLIKNGGLSASDIANYYDLYNVGINPYEGVTKN